MRQKRDDVDLGATDSLLDVVTNVVGIVVLMLAVVLLGARQSLSGPSQESGPSFDQGTVRLPETTYLAARSADAAVFQCRGGKICRIDAEKLSQAVQAAFTGSGTNGNQFDTDSLTRAEKYFRSNDVGDSCFQLELIRRLRSSLNSQMTEVVLRATRRPQSGEDVSVISKSGSAFEEVLHTLSGNGNRPSILFLVWDDSFDVYLEAREVATRVGFKCGWQPYDTAEPFEQSLFASGGGVIPTD